VTTQASIQPRPRDIRVQELTNDSQKIIERDLQCHAQRNRNGLLGRFQRCLQPMRRVALILDAVALAPLVDGLWCYPITGRKNCPCILANFIRRADLRGRRRLLVQDGSAWSHLVPNVPQNRSCHEQGRAPRGNVIIRDGTLMHAMTWLAALNIRLDQPRLAPPTLPADTRCRRQFQPGRRCATA
jgi:hypothetical protein